MAYAKPKHVGRTTQMANDYLRYALFWDVTLLCIIPQNNADLSSTSWRKPEIMQMITIDCAICWIQYHISLICGKSVTTQNLAFLSY